MCKWLMCLGVCLWVVVPGSLVFCQDAPQSKPPIKLSFEGEKLDIWHGFQRHKFIFAGREAWVVEPKTPRSDGAFSWCMMFPDAFTERCAAPLLLQRGFYHVFLDVGNSFGSPESVRILGRFHEMLQQLGFARKAVLIGISRGGLYAHRYAVEFGERVAVIYGDAPVLDFKSWPGGLGGGKGSPSDWEICKKLYGFTDDEAAKRYDGNPIDTLALLSKNKVSLVYVVGEQDDVVPYAENTKIVEQRYPKMGGVVHVFRKPNVGHHPHGLDDPLPVVQFIEAHLSTK